jgi:aminoglycoside phosphotransferase (APT) family kinase protein
VYVLPRLNLGRIGLAGGSSPATVEMLGRHGEIVDLWMGGGRPIDLLWLGEDPAMSPGDPRLPGMTAQLAPGGRVVGDIRRFGSGRAIARLRDDLAQAGLEIELVVWLRPGSGPARTIVPAGDQPTIRFMMDHGLAAPLVRVRAKNRLPALADLERRLAASSSGNRFSQRIGFVARRSSVAPNPVRLTDGAAPSVDRGPVPRWLVDTLAEGGLDIADHRWAFSAPGEYASQKVIWYLFAPDAAVPDLVLKMTRDPAFNGRLENEVAMLRQLERVDLGPGVRVPRASTLRSVGGLAIAVESSVEGEPFAAHVSLEPDDPALSSAVDWLTRLGIATRSPAPAAGLRDALTMNLDRCTGLYDLTMRERAFLTARIERLVDHGCPTVLMHGDPGTWNLLLTPDSRLGILDWEAAEPDGLPLWDLFHLLRSYATLASSSWLPHRSLRLARRQLVDGSTLTATFAASVAAYRDALGLSAEIVEPLYHLGWVHRAVKEASRLAPDRLSRGHYVRLLRSGMSGHATAGLDLLVGGRERDAG